jgi:endonuclease-3
MAPGPAHAALEALMPEGWPAQEVYDHHEVFMIHGQKVCLPRGPKCGKCVILALCPFGQERIDKPTIVSAD